MNSEDKDTTESAGVLIPITNYPKVLGGTIS